MQLKTRTSVAVGSERKRASLREPRERYRSQCRSKTCRTLLSSCTQDLFGKYGWPAEKAIKAALRKLKEAN